MAGTIFVEIDAVKFFSTYLNDVYDYQLGVTFYYLMNSKSLKQYYCRFSLKYLPLKDDAT